MILNNQNLFQYLILKKKFIDVIEDTFDTRVIIFKDVKKALGKEFTEKVKK